MVMRYEDLLSVKYQGDLVGALAFDRGRGLGHFEYDPAFRRKGIELSPLHMPLAAQVYQFPQLDPATFRGLPGMLADALPDDFGNAVLNAWVAREGRAVSSITPVERLKYTGSRGMGALEFYPARQMKGLNASTNVAIDSLVEVAQEVLNQRAALQVNLAAGVAERDAMLSLLSVGSSAGGARPKVVLAFDEGFRHARSGQTDAPAGFTHCLLKFDGVVEQQSGLETFGDPLGFGAMEYTYYQMARQCGIVMEPCWLLDEGPRRHFVTRRFDRRGNRKLHVQTLCGLAHASYKQLGQYSYEEILQLMRRLGLGADDAAQLFRRMVFNVVARNHDDHTKNFAFLLDPDSHAWQLAPAYDIAYSYKPGSHWVNSHATTINGKRDGFCRADFHAFSKLSKLFTPAWIDGVIAQTVDVLAQWPVLARRNAVPDSIIGMVTPNLRLDI